MRTVPGSVTTALTTGNTFRANARLTAYKSRVYFDSTVANSNWINTAPVWAPPAGSTGYPIPEAMAYEGSRGIVSIVLHENSGVWRLFFLIEGYSSPILALCSGSILTTTSNRQRPGIYGNHLWFHDGTNWKQYTIDLSALYAHNGNCLSGATTISTHPEGAIIPVSADEVVVTYIDEGGIRIIYIDSGGIEHICPSKVMIPNRVMSSATDEDVYVMHYMGAVTTSGIVYIYYTQYDGSVWCVTFSMTNDELHGIWSTPFQAIPQDLSRFQVGNAITYGGIIYLIGMFTRTQQFEDSTVYTLLCWSTDGHTFTMNKRTGVTCEQYRFLVDTDGTNLYFGSCNRTDREIAPYYIAGESAPSTVITLVQIQGDPGGGWQASLKSGAELYVDDPNVVEGNFSKLEIGVYTGAAFEYIHYHDCVIDSVSFGWQDGNRTAQISLQADAAYNTSVMTNPMYMQFQNRQYKFDTIADLGNMEKMGGTQFGPAWSLAYDFWDKSLTDGWTWKEMHGGAADIDDWTPDITTFADAYPVLEAKTYDFKIYGWSRAGQHSTDDDANQISTRYHYNTTNAPWGTDDAGGNYASGIDQTVNTTHNPTHKGLLLLEDLDGTRAEVVVDTLIEYGHSNFPQSWYPQGARAGSYPITYTVNGSSYEGWKIIKMGVRTTVGSATAADWNTFYLSRIEMPSVVVHPTRDNNINEVGLDVIIDKTLITPWQVVERLDLLYNSPTSGGYACKPGYVYAVVVQGDIEYIRNGIHYIQDMRFEAHQTVADTSYTTPTWSRTYPDDHSMGYGPTINAGMHVSGKQCPYLRTSGATFTDNVPLGIDVDMDNHCYYMTHDETGNSMIASSIDPAYVPYVYGGGALIYTFTLAGSGTVTLVRNNLQVFLFECPAPNDATLTPWQEMMFYGDVGGNRQVPAPKQFRLDVPGYVQIIPDYLNIWAYNTMKGTPQALFSGSPYSSWNFDAVARTQVVGIYTKSGCVGLATDQYNYLCAWISQNELGIGMMRDGLLTVLITTNDYGQTPVSIAANKAYDIRFWHRDGTLGVEVKQPNQVWPVRGVQLSYTWPDDIGPMAGKETDDVAALVFHMGLFSYIDPPVFRTTGFTSSQNKIPLLPLDHRIEGDKSDFNDDLLFLPGGAKVDIGGITYQYTGKTDVITNPAGPYQARNILYWSNAKARSGTNDDFYWNEDLTEHQTGEHAGFIFDQNWALESTHFEYLESWQTGNHSLYNDQNSWVGGVIAIDTGYAYLIHQVFFRPWIITGGFVVYERERIRIYSNEVMDPDNAIGSLTSKCWITDALTGVTPFSVLDQEYTHPEGSFVFLHNNDQSMHFGFMGISGDYDQSLTTLLDTFCKISGTGAVFPGDFLSVGNGNGGELLGDGGHINLQ